MLDTINASYDVECISCSIARSIERLAPSLVARRYGREGDRRY